MCPRGCAGQGCGEKETSPVSAPVRQALMALGGDMGSWAVGRVGVEPQGSRAGTGKSLVPSKPQQETPEACSEQVPTQ